MSLAQPDFYHHLIVNFESSNKIHLLKVGLAHDTGDSLFLTSKRMRNK